MNDILNQQKPDYLYRHGVGVVIVNDKKQIFVGKRIDNNSDAWQMPQGGIDFDEDEDLAMFRELKEETGITPQKVKILTKSSDYFYYNLPYRLQKKFWGGKYLGQKQRWYLVQFLGSDKDIKIDGEDPEFSAWKWAKKQDVLESIVGFKQQLYCDILEEFKEYLI